MRANLPGVGAGSALRYAVNWTCVQPEGGY